MDVSLEDVAGFIHSYRVLDAKIREWVEMRDSIRARILESLGDAEVGTIAGKPVLKYTRYTQRRISTELLTKKFTADELADCYVETFQRRFSVLQGW